MEKDKNRDIAKDIRKAVREVELEREKTFGGIFRSKTWDELPSHKQERRKLRQKLDLCRYNPENFYED